MIGICRTLRTIGRLPALSRKELSTHKPLPMSTPQITRTTCPISSQLPTIPLRYELYDDVFIVFVTSYPQYMQESFDVQPFQFLTKPVSYTKIEKLLSDIIHRYKHSHITKIVIDSHGKEHLIPVNNILYIQAVKGEKRYLEYHLIDAILTGEANDSGLVEKSLIWILDYHFDFS